MTAPNLLGVLLIVAGIAGCAAAMPGYEPPNSAHKLRAKASAPGSLGEDGRYALNKEEQEFNCKKITGIIHIGILQLREADKRHKPSAIAVNAQKMTGPLGHGSAYGMNPDDEQVQARARLVALNGRLAEKNCPVYDLDKELQPGNTNPPSPIKPQKRK
jgi:hypothetical protein